MKPKQVEDEDGKVVRHMIHHLFGEVYVEIEEDTLNLFIVIVIPDRIGIDKWLKKNEHLIWCPLLKNNLATRMALFPSLPSPLITAKLLHHGPGSVSA